MLTLLDQHHQFVVKVDASDVDDGAVSSQRNSQDGRLHSCAYLSKKLSQAEKNYDIDTRELLAVKVALEEWHHWLEGAEQPLLLWTDHKNLKYLRTANHTAISCLYSPDPPLEQPSFI